ncbi:hypothetical protein [Desulfonatronum parangueonense]
MTEVRIRQQGSSTRPTCDHHGESAGPEAGTVGLFAFVLKALAWGVVVYLLGNAARGHEYWVYVLGVLLLGLPIALSGFYAATINQIQRLAFFTRRGWLYMLLSRRLLKGVLWVCWALVSSFFMLVQFHGYGQWEWAAFFLVVPVFWLVFLVCRRMIVRELKPYLVTSMALAGARRIAPLLMAGLYVAALFFLSDQPRFDSLQAAIDAEKARSVHITGSALVFEAAQYAAVFNGAKVYALGHLGREDALPAAAMLGVGSMVIFFNACAMLSCFLIPIAEYRRVFGPLTEQEIPPPLRPMRMAVVSAVFTFGVLFLYLPLMTSLEAWVRQTPEVTQARAWTEVQVVRVEQIGEDFFREGTLDELESARLETLRRLDFSLARVEVEAERAFDRMENNVDHYLDWYYSLPGEYARIMNLLLGELEDYMARQLEDSLLQGDPFAPVEVALREMLAEHEAAVQAYQEHARRIMSDNRIDPGQTTGMHVVRRIALGDVLQHDDLIGFKTRLAGSGLGGAGAAAGMASAVVAKKVSGKVAGKGALKYGAKALAKVTAGKAAGSATGAAAGAAVGAAAGSVIPVLGTAAGAVAGGIIGGIAAGVTMDKMLLMLESAFSREKFKAEIMEAIAESRAEFMEKLRGCA